MQVELVYSKQYQHREKGLMAVKEVLSAPLTHSKPETLKAVCLLLKRAFGDKVYAVSFSLWLYKIFFLTYFGIFGEIKAIQCMCLHPRLVTVICQLP